MAGFLFAGDAFAVDEAAAAKVLTADAAPVLDEAILAVEAVPEFTAAALEAELKSRLIDKLGLKPRVAFGAVRVAVTGRPVSPPLYESMELLGRETSLARLRAARNAI